MLDSLLLDQLSLVMHNVGPATSFEIKAMLVQDGKHVLIEVSLPSSQGKFINDILLLKVFSLQQSPTDEVIDTLHASLDVMTNIEVSPGILPDKKLVFFHSDLRICAFRLRLGNAIFRSVTFSFRETG